MKLFFLPVFLCFFVSTIAQIKINIDPGNIKLRNKGSNSSDNSNNSNSSTTKTTNTNYNFEINRNAPMDVNYNLTAGSPCVVVDERGYVSRRSIYQVVEGGYAIVKLGTTQWELTNNANAIEYFATNSVYPDIDFVKFDQLVRGYSKYIEHYLNCYTQNHLPSLNVLTRWNERWPKYYLGSVKEAKEHLFKLKSLDSIMKLNYPSIPNFYCQYEYNPFIWAQIASKRDSMVACLLSTSGEGEVGIQLKNWISEIEEGINFAKNYSVGDEWKLKYEIIDYSVSPKGRAEKLKEANNFFNEYSEFITLIGKNHQNLARDTINYLYDKLKEELKIALPKYKPEEYIFKYHDSGLETKMKAYLKSPSSLTIYKIGLTHEIWQVAYNNSGIPSYKYKYGAMYVKNKTWDHNYCNVLYFTLKQDYTGAGTYGESYVGHYSNSYFGCP